MLINIPNNTNTIINIKQTSNPYTNGWYTFINIIDSLDTKAVDRFKYEISNTEACNITITRYAVFFIINDKNKPYIIQRNYLFNKLIYEYKIDIPDNRKYVYFSRYLTTTIPYQFNYHIIHFTETDAIQYILSMVTLLDSAEAWDYYTNNIQIYKIPIYHRHIVTNDIFINMYHTSLSNHKNNSPEDLYNWLMEFCLYEKRIYSLDIDDIDKYTLEFMYGLWKRNGQVLYKSYEDYMYNQSPKFKLGDPVYNVHGKLLYVTDCSKDRALETDDPLFWSHTVYLSKPGSFDDEIDVIDTDYELANNVSDEQQKTDISTIVQYAKENLGIVLNL